MLLSLIRTCVVTRNFADAVGAQIQFQTSKKIAKCLLFRFQLTPALKSGFAYVMWCYCWSCSAFTVTVHPLTFRELKLKLRWVVSNILLLEWFYIFFELDCCLLTCFVLGNFSIWCSDINLQAEYVRMCVFPCKSTHMAYSCMCYRRKTFSTSKKNVSVSPCSVRCKFLSSLFLLYCHFVSWRCHRTN